MGNARHKDKAQERSCVGTRGEKSGSNSSGTVDSKAGAYKWKKGECMSTARRGNISVMTCLSPRVLENVMVSDSKDRDVIFPIM